MEITTDFNLGDKVRLVDHNVRGVINSIWINRSISPAVQYEVEWLDKNGLLNYKYFSVNELRRCR